MTVTTDTTVINTMDELKEYVYSALCADNDLLADAFPTTSTPLRTHGELCGMIFCVHGPRRVDFSAIWEKKNNRIMFYKPNGERYRLVKLAGTRTTNR
ncbi:MAG: hypothetical protein ACOX0A_09260 [Thermoguttaceae bacterium]|jgi:hypothetical protein